MTTEVKISAPEFLILGGTILVATGNHIAGCVVLSLGVTGAVLRTALHMQQEKERQEAEAETKRKGYESVVAAGRELGEILKNAGATSSYRSDYDLDDLN